MKNSSDSTKRSGSAKAKKQITINLDEEVITYFKEKATETHLPYQTLINLYLLECVRKNKNPNISWD